MDFQGPAWLHTWFQGPSVSASHSKAPRVLKLRCSKVLAFRGFRVQGFQRSKIIHTHPSSMGPSTRACSPGRGKCRAYCARGQPRRGTSSRTEKQNSPGISQNEGIHKPRIHRSHFLVLPPKSLMVKWHIGCSHQQYNVSGFS